MKKSGILLLLLIVIMISAACGGQTSTTSARDENLAKLGRVWGFVKYTHNSFILGQLDWDRELLSLIPIIYYADPEDVNGILYDWFVGLGDDGYDLDPLHDYDTLSAAYPAQQDALRQMADLSWINYDYIGQLASHLLRFDGITAIDRTSAPVFLTLLSAPPTLLTKATMSI